MEGFTWIDTQNDIKLRIDGTQLVMVQNSFRYEYEVLKVNDFCYRFLNQDNTWTLLVLNTKTGNIVLYQSNILYVVKKENI